MPFKDPILGGDDLVRPQMQSPNYVAGSSGWVIKKDGSVEFNNGTFRGELTSGTNPGQHVIINNNLTGNAVEVYNSSNVLVFAVTNNGEMFAYNPGGTQYVEAYNAHLYFSEVAPHAPNISAQIIGLSSDSSSSMLLQSGKSVSTNNQATLTMNEGAPGNEYIQIHQRGINGSIVQTDTNRTNSFMHAGVYSGTVAGGDGHWIFSHNCSFTPTGAVLTPYAAGGGDGAGYVRMWTTPVDATSCYTIWTNDGGGRTADGTTVGVNAIFFG